MTFREEVHQFEADVVSGFLVFRPWIAEADDEADTAGGGSIPGPGTGNKSIEKAHERTKSIQRRVQPRFVGEGGPRSGKITTDSPAIPQPAGLYRLPHKSQNSLDNEKEQYSAGYPV